MPDMLDVIVPAVIGVVVLAVIGVMIWAALSGGPSCAQGQHLAILTWIPITVGKTIVITPIYHCVAGA